MFYKTVRRFLNPDGSQGGAPSGEQTDQQSQQNVAPQIDYGKIQQMLDGTLAAKEDTALKAYFSRMWKHCNNRLQPQQLRQDRHRSNRQRRWQQSDWESV